MDLSGIAKIKSLRRISISFMPRLLSFPDLAACKNLQCVKIDTCKRLCDIKSVTKIKSLRELSTCGTALEPRDFKPIMRMPNIKYVNCQFKRVGLNDEFESLLQEHKLNVSRF